MLSNNSPVSPVPAVDDGENHGKADRPVAAETAPLDGESVAPLPSGAILLVEDEEPLRFMGEALLTMLGFRVITAADGVEALATYRERGGEIDVIMMDVVMPEMGGLEAYRELRAGSCNVPVILCSGYCDDEVEREIVNDSHATILEKPYEPEELRTILAIMKKKQRGSFPPARPK